MENRSGRQRDDGDIARGGSQTRRWRCYRHRVAARVSFPSRSFPLTIYKSYQIFYF